MQPAKHMLAHSDVIRQHCMWSSDHCDIACGCQTTVTCISTSSSSMVLSRHGCRCNPLKSTYKCSIDLNRWQNVRVRKSCTACQSLTHCNVFCAALQVIRHYHGHLSGVYSLALHPTLDLLMTGGRDSVCRVWDMRSKVQAHVLSGHDDTVCSILSQPTDPQVRCCQVASKQLIRILSVFVFRYRAASDADSIWLLMHKWRQTCPLQLQYNA